MSLILSIGYLLLTLVLCKTIYDWIFREKKHMDIPGPTGWPLVGNSLQMDPTSPHNTFSEWSKKYGAIFKIRIFKDDVVILNDYELIREMLTSESCSLRPYSFRMHGIALKGVNDIVFKGDSPEWYENKKALSRALNAYGTGSMKIEAITSECIDKLFVNIEESTNNFKESIDMKPYIHRCVAGIIITLFSGEKLSESEIMELLELERRLLKFASPAALISVLDHFPWMRHLPLKSIQEPIKDVLHYMQWAKDRQKEWGSKDMDEKESILHSLMQHVNRVTGKVMPPLDLAGVTHNIIAAGFVTSTAALYSLILVLINFPEIQEKMHKEIEQVTSGRRPSVSDRQRMPYVRAVMEETFRFSSVTPMTFYHYTGKDTTINGTHIQKGTSLLANLWGLHHDEKYFDDPWKFVPERFLDESGQMVASHHPIRKHFFPFGSGRRICPGEGLARNRIFLIIASLLQKYRFLPEDDQNIPSCDPREFDGGLIVMPFKYKVQVIERF